MGIKLDECKLVNETILSQLETPGMEKIAIDAINDYTRTKMREDGFARRILPMLPISNDELDRQVSTDKNVKIIDKEPDSPASITIPYATLPTNVYIRAPRYAVTFCRVVTPRFTKDVSELRSYTMDVRQVLSDNAIKDMLAEEDSKFITAVNTILVGQNAVVPVSGVAQWITIGGGINRDSLFDARKVMPRTPSRLEPHTVLCNNITINEVCKFGRDEMGGNLSEDIMRDGWSLQRFMGLNWIITIKQDLVPTDTLFFFADPKFLGKSFELEAPTMYIKKEAYMLDFFAYEEIGASLGHSGGLARVDFT